MKSNRLLLPIFAACAIGCQTGTLPNPNDPADVGTLSADNISDQLRTVSDSLMLRESRGEISERQRRDLLKLAADDLLKTGGVSLDKIDVTKAWKYGEVMINAEHWSDAKVVLGFAVEQAKVTHNEDRRVNDSLRLAEVDAQLGDLNEAIKMAKSVFNAKPEDSAPVLYAVLYKIVPAGQGKGKDIELAHLLEDAIAIDVHVKVDLSSKPGRDFVEKRPVHILHAWRAVEELYTKANRPDLATEAQTKEAAMAHDFTQEPNFFQGRMRDLPDDPSFNPSNRI